MTVSSDYDIKVLNGLIETILDSAHGYKEAAKEVKNPDFRSLFERRANERKRLCAELQSQVRSMGGEPEDDGSILASAHRVFLNLKHIVSGSDQGVVDEVEAGEDHIKAKFEDAINDGDLSHPVKSVVTQLYAAIKAEHDSMRDLKHNINAHS
jgi:uncharacterized protein (TIGR02284 family)